MVVVPQPPEGGTLWYLPPKSTIFSFFDVGPNRVERFKDMIPLLLHVFSPFYKSILLLLMCEGKIKEDAMKNRIRLKKAKCLTSQPEYFLFVINVKWFNSFISPEPCVGVGQVDWRLSHRPRLEDKLHPQVLLTGSPEGKTRIPSSRISGVWYGVFYSIRQGMPRCF